MEKFAEWIVRHNLRYLMAAIYVLTLPAAIAIYLVVETLPEIAGFIARDFRTLRKIGKE